MERCPKVLRWVRQDAQKGMRGRVIQYAVLRGVLHGPESDAASSPLRPASASLHARALAHRCIDIVCTEYTAYTAYEAGHNRTQHAPTDGGRVWRIWPANPGFRPDLGTRHRWHRRRPAWCWRRYVLTDGWSLEHGSRRYGTVGGGSHVWRWHRLRTHVGWIRAAERQRHEARRTAQRRARSTRTRTRTQW